MRLKFDLPGGKMVPYRGGVTASTSIAIESQVHALRKFLFQGKPYAFAIDALAFIPEHYRAQIPRAKAVWVNDELLWVRVGVPRNAKTLAPFMASDDMEWKLGEAGK